MCRHRRVPLRNLDDKNAEERAFFDSVRREMQELAEEAGDWRIHLPYEALVSYRLDSRVRAQYSEHYRKCEFCQKAMDALNPNEK